MYVCMGQIRCVPTYIHTITVYLCHRRRWANPSEIVELLNFLGSGWRTSIEKVVCIRVLIHMPLYTYIHTCIHTYIHTYTYLGLVGTHIYIGMSALTLRLKILRSTEAFLELSQFFALNASYIHIYIHTYIHT